MLACLYDVHGNLPALEAVLADAESAGAASFFVGGDHSAFGAWPAECVGRLRELAPATWIRGNWERWQDGEDADMPAGVAAARDAVVAALGDELVRELAALPDRDRDGDTLRVHASVRSDMESWRPEPGEDDTALLAGERPARVVFGHLHRQFVRAGPDAVELVGPGSVGLPLDGDPRAAYALVAPDGAVRLRRVAYDAGRAARALEERFGAPEWVQRTTGALRAGGG